MLIKHGEFMRLIFENAFYLLALLNPASKVMFLAAYEPKLSSQRNFELSWKSSSAALGILIFLAAVGQFLLSRIFRVELYSLQITGGIVVLCIGWTAIHKGKFVNQEQSESRIENLTDISLVPLAAPLIAGPGMIAATIAGCVKDGFWVTCAALTLAMLVNFFLMLFSIKINYFLTKTHLLGPIIRLTGLVIAIVSMQMIISGIKSAINI